MPTIDAYEPDRPAFARRGINLASAGLGARGLFATDAFFAPLSRMLEDAAPVFMPGKYDANGKWMDGWESRRRRDTGHDHAVIRLAAPGRILGFDVDTAHFTGNYAPAVRIEGAGPLDGDPDAGTVWRELLALSPLGPDAHHWLSCAAADPVSHLRVHIHPDGGIARLRAYGLPQIAPADGAVDVAASLSGGRILGFSDAHYGDWRRLLAPGRGRDMGDGWETRRRREPGHDWIVIALGARARIERVVIDTAHFKGNFPDSASIQAADMTGFGADTDAAVVTAAMFWPTLLGPQRLGPDAEHAFSDLPDIGPVSHVRLNIHPDGGVSRLRVIGRVL